MRALTEVAYPHERRPNPDAYCLCEATSQLRRIAEHEMQDEGNGNQRERDRNRQSGCPPAEAREIDEPKERRQDPVKRGFPNEVVIRQRRDMTLIEVV